MLDRVSAFIDLNRLYQNYHSIQIHCDPSVFVMAVVKADAYGHGAIPVATYLSDHGVRQYGVHSLSEALELRNAGVQGEILIFGRVDSQDASILKRSALIPTIPSLQDAQMLISQAEGVVADNKIDTGMSRFGLPCHQETDLEKTLAEIRSILALDKIKIRGIYTHFASADNSDSTFTHHQAALFSWIQKRLLEDGRQKLVFHAANSAATIRYPEYHFQMVRTGIMLYGYPPVQTTWDLSPALTLKAKIIDLRTVRAGESVSYGQTYVSSKTSQIATLAIGYADGYFRSLSNRGLVRIKGQNCPIVGRVCMDACMVDVTGLTLAIGEEATIIGKNHSAELTAALADTISYEVLTNISKRVPRVYPR
ncbi:MAG: alanine racemase [Candidatus Izemoplasmatales bacterium]|nr:alanine racemase [Candidatus Izemoplasmatales bacterium]